MKKIFVVACKIIGLLQLYWAFATLVQVGFAFSMMKDLTETGAKNVMWLAGTILYIVLAFAVAYAMIFRTDALGRIVGIPDDPDSGRLPPQEALLKTGILLIGVYFVLVPIPGIVKHIGDALYYRQITRQFSWISQTVGYVCQMGLAVFLLKEPDKVIEFITKKKEHTEPTN
jgi:hypothetical protein